MACWRNCCRRLFSQSSVSPSTMSTPPPSPPGSPNRASEHEERTPPVEEVEEEGQRLRPDGYTQVEQEDRTDRPTEQRIERIRGGGIFSFLSRSYSQGPPPDYSKMPLKEKRQHYKCGDNYVTLDMIPTWEEQSGCHSDRSFLASKLSLWRGDITRLEIDAIVNAANSSLLGGGGVDGAIHRAAGRLLLEECRKLNGCDAGDAKLTGGHKLPAKYILHTVGPMNRSERTLTNCYTSCLKLVEEHNLRSVAFCCVSTGVYGYPNKAAAQVALRTVRTWLTSNSDKVDRIIFCVFLDIDYNIYRKLLHQYFTVEEEGKNETDGADQEVTKGKMDEADQETTKSEMDEADQEATKSEMDEADQETTKGEMDIVKAAKKEEDTAVTNERPPTLQRSVTEPAHRLSTQEETKPLLEHTESAEMEMEGSEDCSKTTDSPPHDTKRPKTSS